MISPLLLLTSLPYFPFDYVIAVVQQMWLHILILGLWFAYLLCQYHSSNQISWIMSLPSLSFCLKFTFLSEVCTDHFIYLFIF